MNLGIVMRLGHRDAQVLAVVEIDVVELSGFELALHWSDETRERHHLHGEGAFWKPVAALAAMSSISVDRLCSTQGVKGVDSPPYSVDEASLRPYVADEHDEEVRAGVEIVLQRLRGTVRTAGGNLYKMSPEPMLHLGIDSRHFLSVQAVVHEVPKDGPNGLRFSFKEMEALDEMRRRIRGRGDLPPMPIMLSAVSDRCMDSTASEQLFVAGVQRWLTAEINWKRTGMLPVETMIRLRRFVRAGEPNGLSLGGLLLATTDDAVRARRPTANDNWYDGTVESLSSALLLARRRCEHFHPHLLVDVVSDLDGLAL